MKQCPVASTGSTNANMNGGNDNDHDDDGSGDQAARGQGGGGSNDSVVSSITQQSNNNNNNNGNRGRQGRGPNDAVETPGVVCSQVKTASMRTATAIVMNNQAFHERMRNLLLLDNQSTHHIFCNDSMQKKYASQMIL